MMLSVLITLAVNFSGSPLVAYQPSPSTWLVGPYNGVQREIRSPSVGARGAFLDGKFVLTTETGKFFTVSDITGDLELIGSVPRDDRVELLSVSASTTGLYALWYGGQHMLILDHYGLDYKLISSSKLSESLSPEIMSRIHILGEVVLRVSSDGHKGAISYSNIHTRDPESILFSPLEPNAKKSLSRGSFIMGFLADTPILMDKNGVVTIGGTKLEGQAKGFFASNGRMLLLGLRRDGKFFIVKVTQGERLLSVEDFGRFDSRMKGATRLWSSSLW